MSVIYETNDYSVEIGKCRIKGTWEGLEGYLIRNKRTGVVEGEVSVEFSAMQTVNNLQRDLEAVLDNPDSVPPQPDDAFEDMITRLQDDKETSE